MGGVEFKLLDIIACKSLKSHSLNYFHLVIPRDIAEISHVTNRKLDELKCSMQPVKIIRRLDPFETQIGRCDKGRREWSSEKKNKIKSGENRGFVRVKSIHISIIVDITYHCYHSGKMYIF